MLSFEQANHISQLLLSKEVYINDENGWQQLISITDLTSEVSDADNATKLYQVQVEIRQEHFPD